MKLSIIIPVFKVPSTLRSCVDSVLSGCDIPVEVILVDDGSPDECPAICDEIAVSDSRVKVIHQSNQGLSAARNVGIDASTGELLTFVDSDDLVEPGQWSRLTEVFGQHERCDIVEYPVVVHQDDRHREYRLVFGGRFYADAGHYWSEERAYTHAYACNKIFRRHLFDKVRFPVGRVFEDVATIPSLLCAARGIATVGFGCYFYRANAEGITATASGKELSMLLEHHLRWFEMWPSRDYYIHLVNIQLSVCDRLPVSPVLPFRPYTGTLKLYLLRIFGMVNLCRMHRIFYRLFRL